VIRLIRRPRDLRVRTAAGLFSGMAAIDAAQGLAAVVDNGVVRLIDLRTGAAVGHLPGNSATYVAFGGPRLLVQAKDGSLEVWNARGTARQRVIAGDQTYGRFNPVPDAGGGLVLRQRSDGSVALADLSSGTTLATLPAPASASLGLRIGLAFSPDSQNLISVVQTISGNTLEIIERAIGAQTLVHAACVTAGRNLTRAEWRSFVGTSPPGNLACR
jgi:WD40 repeat protein